MKFFGVECQHSIIAVDGVEPNWPVTRIAEGSLVQLWARHGDRLYLVDEYERPSSEVPLHGREAPVHPASPPASPARAMIWMWSRPMLRGSLEAELYHRMQPPYRIWEGISLELRELVLLAAREQGPPEELWTADEIEYRDCAGAAEAEPNWLTEPIALELFEASLVSAPALRRPE